MKKMMIWLFFLISTCLFAPVQLQGKVRLPALFTDGMVLQQRHSVAVWGWAAPHEEIIIHMGWTSQQAEIRADDQGNWLTHIRTPSGGGSYTMQVEGSNTVEIHNVLIGEVWICSGQSNMEFPLENQGKWKTGVVNHEREITLACYPNIRLFHVQHHAAQAPQQDVTGTWTACSPETAGSFSAVAYYFARKLHKALGYPIGIIHASWGGTPAESWVKKEVLSESETLRHLLDKQQEVASRKSSTLYNGMISPLIPFTVKGFVWYQGESNSDRAEEYKKLFPALIANWRMDWKENLPFYFVQIAPHAQKGPLIREAQLMTLGQVENTGMAVITDAADSLDIHPRNKQFPGERLALWALANTYGQEITYSGPIYQRMRIEGNKIRLFFDHADGLQADKEPLREFVICGEDKVFVRATAKIENNTILVSNQMIDKPIAVRFAWKNFPRPNLYNQAALPASPFRTDAWDD
ncbi:sialate O-acetylesterase [Sphingobacterium sp. N143]|uniref:sialate O-acetylesterase n=1 Tax=Sphingobacterium sp. N143 TaxID=2746727 RepID=UPI002577CB9F|nr:sialate O-acetylesterase [Sphingobacterium sp. N143]MDM1295000.1 sialate O-acetylesterase [Sphingobacterium sp. N143]